MVNVYYTVIKTPSITDQQYKYYSAFIGRTLKDPRGWRKMDYHFKEVSNDTPAAIKVRFLTDESMVKKFDNSIKGLSAYYPLEHAIYFNLHNWF